MTTADKERDEVVTTSTERIAAMERVVEAARVWSQ
jgi:hypothetical protein